MEGKLKNLNGYLNGLRVQVVGENDGGYTVKLLEQPNGALGLAYKIGDELFVEKHELEVQHGS